MAECRSCSAPVTWALTVNGRRMPVDVDPVPDGNLLLEQDERGQAIVWNATPGSQPLLWTSHFATCPQAAQHRRRAS